MIGLPILLPRETCAHYEARIARGDIEFQIKDDIFVFFHGDHEVTVIVGKMTSVGQIVQRSSEDIELRKRSVALSHASYIRKTKKGTR